VEFGNVGFCGGRKTAEPGENPQGKSRTENKLNPHMAQGRWEASALITAPSLLPGNLLS